MAGPEKTFENKIKKYLKSRGHWCVKFFANSFTPAGIPDILACINAYFVGIEVKAENGHPSALQYHERDKIRDSNGISIIIYPHQWENFLALVCALENDDFTVAKEIEKNFN